MRILLVRHGESLGNVDPLIDAMTADHAVPLSVRGVEQAREAGRRDRLGSIARSSATSARTSGCG